MEIDGFHSTLAWRLQADNWTNLGGTLIYKDYEGISMLYATYDLHRVKSEDTAGHRKWISQIAILDELASTIFIWHLFSLATAGKSTQWDPWFTPVTIAIVIATTPVRPCSL